MVMHETYPVLCGEVAYPFGLQNATGSIRIRMYYIHRPGLYEFFESSLQAINIFPGLSRCG